MDALDEMQWFQADRKLDLKCFTPLTPKAFLATLSMDPAFYPMRPELTRAMAHDLHGRHAEFATVCASGPRAGVLEPA